MPIARQRVGKHVPSEAYRGTIGRPFLDNGAVNTSRETVFYVGSAPRLYNAEFQMSSQSENSCCASTRMRIEGVQRSATEYNRASLAKSGLCVCCSYSETVINLLP
jgi:hypothetical protein